MTTRDELIEAGAQALRDYWIGSDADLDGYMCPNEDDYHACSIQAGCEPVPTAIGREVVDAVLADLRRQVEALPETRDLDPWDWNEVVEVVLALLDGASDD